MSKTIPKVGTAMGEKAQDIMWDLCRSAWNQYGAYLSAAEAQLIERAAESKLADEVARKAAAKAAAEAKAIQLAPKQEWLNQSSNASNLLSAGAQYISGRVTQSIMSCGTGNVGVSATRKTMASVMESLNELAETGLYEITQTGKRNWRVSPVGDALTASGESASEGASYQRSLAETVDDLPDVPPNNPSGAVRVGGYTTKSGKRVGPYTRRQPRS